MTRRRSKTPEQVRIIRQWWKLRQIVPTIEEMARLQRVSRATLRRIATGVNYRDVQP